MTDPIAKAYKNLISEPQKLLKKAEQVEKLPMLIDAVETGLVHPELNEQYHESSHDPYDHAQFLQDLQDAHELYSFHADQDGEHHDSAIHDILRKGIPTAEKFNTMHSIIDSAEPKTRAKLKMKYGFVKDYLPTTDIENKHSDNFLQPHEIANIKKNPNLVLANGRKVKDMNTGMHYQLTHEGLLKPSSNHYDHVPFHDSETTTSAAEAHHELGNLHHDHIEHDDVLKKSVKKYTEDSSEINSTLGARYEEKDVPRSPLWKMSETEVDELSHNISEGIRKAPPIKHPVKVYSGISNKVNIFGRTGNGKKELKFHSPTFLSTSLYPSIAMEFARSNMTSEEIGNHPVRDMIETELPSGFSGGMYVEPHTTTKNEFEYILDKGHDITIHPEPRYFAKDRTLFRVWKAKVHQK
jgi:hypothetical protein